MMRVLLAGLVVVTAGCAHELRPTVAVPPPPIDKVAPPPPQPSEYVLADPGSSRTRVVALPLGSPTVTGLVVGKRRLVVGQGEPRVAPDAPDVALTGVARIPRRFGAGFLFWTTNALYRAETFDGSLTPIAHVPDTIESVSFMPKALLVRTHNGERWGLGLPKGERAPVGGPLGVVDLEALDDGRAVAFNDQGAVFTSTDHGAHWSDATAQVRSSPTRVTEIGGEVWIFESNGGASRLEADGRLSWFDKAPTEPAAEVRVRDPRWHGSDGPLRAVFRGGAAVDESTAIVVDAGNIVRVDLQSGDLVSVVFGRLPPDAVCEGVPVLGDVLFACNAPGASGSAFVVTHTLSGDGPAIEQSFASSGRFFASVDGGLAFGGPCQGTNPNSDAVVCVRTSSGRWEERDLSGFTQANARVARWVPRVDGRVVAVVIDPNPGLYDPVTNVFQALPDEARELASADHSTWHHVKSGKLVYRRPAGGTIVDGMWSFTNGGTIRGWRTHGGAFEISDDGKITQSPYSFDVRFSGLTGIGRSSEGRLYQSSDLGVSWTEVAAPPSGAEGLDLTSCTSAGCDLGAFYRLGWPTRPPRVDPTNPPAPRAPEVRRVRGLELACKPQGAPIVRALSRSSDSPEDLGLGAVRLPMPSSNGDVAYVRNAVPRGIVSPIHEVSSGDGDATPSLRAMFSGYATSRDGDALSVLGPVKNPVALRRQLSFVAPFDPSGRVVRAAIPMTEVIAAGRKAGMSNDEILAEDFTESGAVIALLSADPAAPSEIATHNVDHGLVTFTRGDRVRAAVRPNQNGTNVVSGVVTGVDEAAFLEIDTSGVGHVFKVAGGAITDLFDVSPTTNDTLAAANPDALAVGPKNELAVLRTPSGSDPASSFDPAFLIVPAMPPVPLAAWTEVRFADDPACKAEQGGYRAVLQLIAPWIRFTNPDLRAEEGATIARVRWTPKRVCLEGFEVRGPAASVRAASASASGGGESVSLSTWIVARGSTIARVGVADGVEWRQPLECSVVTTGP